MRTEDDPLNELDQRLRSIRFQPRASFEPELLGRLRRGDPPRPPSSPWLHYRAHVAALAFTVTAIGAGAYHLINTGSVTVDRCCYDLDGGGLKDDGMLIAAGKNSTIRRLRVYEDVDSSGNHTLDDIIRLDRGEKPAILTPDEHGLVAIRRCCGDLDGEGPADDGLLIVGVPPDRVLMAAIFETDLSAATDGPAAGWILR